MFSELISLECYNTFLVVMAAVAAISAVSYADWSSEVYTNEINEVKWRFRIDTSNNRLKQIEN